MNSDITTFRRTVLALVSVLFLGLAFSSVANAKLRLVESKYKVELNGIHVHDWYEQDEPFPATDRVWETERGTITSGFTTKRPVIFKGTRYIGKVPGVELPEFTFHPMSEMVTKADNAAKVTAKKNWVPECGGELGECDGSEKSGVETTNRKCRKANAKLPFRLEHGEGRNARLDLSFGFHPSNRDFCGKKFEFFNSVDRLPEKMGLGRGLELISKMKKGQTRTWKGSKETGETFDFRFGVPKTVKKCPAMSGTGIRRCWITDMRIDITRIR